MPRTSSEIADLITQYCEAEGLLPGDRLPPERQLVVILEMSRTEIRRGLARLEADRQIVRHVGRGTFIKTDALDPRGVASPREILDVRLLLEPAVMPLVVANSTPGDLDLMAHCLEQSERAASQEEFELWDAALHTAIVESTQNRLIISIYRKISEARDDAVWGNLKRASFSDTRRSAYEEHHRAIVAALLDRDSATAALAITDHVRQVADNMLNPDVR
jgi:DNA-binding FadR family transcriptional regulator